MSTPKRKIAVEPLSRAAWDRVESKLFASLDRGEHLAPEPDPQGGGTRSWRRVAVAVPAFAAAAAVALLLRSHRVSNEPNPSTAEPTPVAALTRPPASGVQTILADGSRIETTTQPVQSSIGDSVLDIAEHTSLRVSGSDARGWLVELDAGQVNCRIAPRQGRPPFAVRAGETRVTVVGTRFSVERRDAGARVAVQEGIVRVQSGAQTLLLHPGEAWPDESAPQLSPPPEPAAPAPHAAARVRPPQHSMGAAGKEQRRFERAARLEATDPQAALRIYSELSRHGAWSANALYARGRLELSLGQPRGKKDLELYLKRYPNGPNADDVRALLRDASSGEAPHHAPLD